MPVTTAPNPTAVAALVSEILDAKESRHGSIRFTIERGNGETYRNDNWTIYAHDSYPRSSVLSGRSRRRWIEDVEGTPECLAIAEAACKQAKVRFTVSGASFQPDPMNDLPDDAG